MFVIKKIITCSLFFTSAGSYVTDGNLLLLFTTLKGHVTVAFVGVAIRATDVILPGRITKTVYIVTSTHQSVMCVLTVGPIATLIGSKHTTAMAGVFSAFHWKKKSRLIAREKQNKYDVQWHKLCYVLHNYKVSGNSVERFQRCWADKENKTNGLTDGRVKNIIPSATCCIGLITSTST